MNATYFVWPKGGGATGALAPGLLSHVSFALSPPCVLAEGLTDKAMWTIDTRSEVAWSQIRTQRLFKGSATGVPPKSSLRKVRETYKSLLDPSSLERPSKLQAATGLQRSHVALPTSLVHMQGRKSGWITSSEIR